MKLLKLIETVDKDDTQKLDEIDARVYLYKERLDIPVEKLLEVWKGDLTKWVMYTRSRDALKAIRPDGWVFNVKQFGLNSYHSNAFKHRDDTLKIYADTPYVTTSGLKIKSLPTEELAELHAIIQAIEWERKNDKE